MDDEGSSENGQGSEDDATMNPIKRKLTYKEVETALKKKNKQYDSLRNEMDSMKQQLKDIKGKTKVDATAASAVTANQFNVYKQHTEMKFQNMVSKDELKQTIATFSQSVSSLLATVAEAGEQFAKDFGGISHATPALPLLSPTTPGEVGSLSTMKIDSDDLENVPKGGSVVCYIKKHNVSVCFPKPLAELSVDPKDGTYKKPRGKPKTSWVWNIHHGCWITTGNKVTTPKR